MTEALDREITKQRTENITVKDIKKKTFRSLDALRVTSLRLEVDLPKQEAVRKDRKYKEY